MFGLQVQVVFGALTVAMRCCQECSQSLNTHLCSLPAAAGRCVAQPWLAWHLAAACDIACWSSRSRRRQRVQFHEHARCNCMASAVSVSRRDSRAHPGSEVQQYGAACVMGVLWQLQGFGQVAACVFCGGRVCAELLAAPVSAFRPAACMVSTQDRPADGLVAAGFAIT